MRVRHAELYSGLIANLFNWGVAKFLLCLPHDLGQFVTNLAVVNLHIYERNNNLKISRPIIMYVIKKVYLCKIILLINRSTKNG